MRSKKLISLLCAAALTASSLASLAVTASAAGEDLLTLTDFTSADIIASNSEDSDTAKWKPQAGADQQVVTVEEDEEGTYLKSALAGGTAAGSTYNTTYKLATPITATNYVIEFDTSIHRSNGMHRTGRMNQIAFTSSSAAMDPRKYPQDTNASSLETGKVYSSGIGVALNARWTVEGLIVNDLATAETDPIVTTGIPVEDNQWIRVQAVINSTTKKANITVIDASDNKILDNAEYACDATQIDAIHLIPGRGDPEVDGQPVGGGIVCIDNVHIYEGAARTLTTDGLRGEVEAPEIIPEPETVSGAAPALKIPASATEVFTENFNALTAGNILTISGEDQDPVAVGDNMTASIGKRQADSTTYISKVAVDGADKAIKLSGGTQAHSGRTPMLHVNNSAIDSTKTNVLGFSVYISKIDARGTEKLWLVDADKTNIASGDINDSSSADTYYKGVFGVLTSEDTTSGYAFGSSINRGITVSAGAWHTVVVAVDGNGRYRIFVDGEYKDPKKSDGIQAAVLADTINYSSQAYAPANLPVIAIENRGGGSNKSVALIDNVIRYTVDSISLENLPSVEEAADPSHKVEVTPNGQDITVKSLDTADDSFNGVLIHSKYTDKALTSIKTYNLSGSNTITKAGTVYSIPETDKVENGDKLMVWNSLAGMIPYCAAVTVSGGTQPEPTTYAVTLPQNTTEGDAVTADKSTAAAAETVTLTVAPANGRRLVADSLKVNDGAVTVTKVSDTTYTFPMPAGAATVTAQFEAIPPTTYTAKVTADTGIEKVQLKKDSTVKDGTAANNVYTFADLPVADTYDVVVTYKTGYEKAANEAAKTVSNTSVAATVASKAKTYAIKYNNNGHGSTIADGSYTYDAESVTLDSSITDTDYNFGGWYMEAGCTTAATKDAIKAAITDNNVTEVTVYAKWTEKSAPTYNVTITADEHITAVKLGTKEADAKDANAHTFTFNGVTADTYTFDVTYATGYTAADDTPANIAVTASKLEETIGSKAKTYTIKYNLNDHGDAIQNGSFKYDATEIALATPTAEGFTFEGWYTDTNLTTAAATDSIKALITDNTVTDVTVYAKWTQNAPTTFTASVGSVTGIKIQKKDVGEAGTGNVTGLSANDKVVVTLDDTDKVLTEVTYTEGETTGKKAKITDGAAEITVTDGNIVITAVTLKTKLTAVAMSDQKNAPKVGVAITTTLTPNDATATYQWYSKGEGASAEFEAINEATSASYTPTANDIGKTLKVVATGSENYTGEVSDTTTAAVSALTYTITAPDEVNTVTIAGQSAESPYSAKEGDTVTFKVTIPDNKKADGAVSVNDADTSTLTGPTTEGVYSFTMPAKPVTITVPTADRVNSKITFENPTGAAVAVTAGESTTVTSNDTEVAEGETVTVAVTPESQYNVTKVTVTGEEISYDSSAADQKDITVDGNNYSFTMPAKAVTVAVVTEVKPVAAVKFDKPASMVAHDTQTTYTAKLYADEEGTIDITDLVTDKAVFAWDITTTDNNITLTQDETDKNKAVLAVPSSTEATSVTVTAKFGSEENSPKAEQEVQITADPIYNVTIADADNGTVEVDAHTAKANDEVTITATPSTGYKVDTITVKGTADDDKDKATTVTDNKFTMPAYGVTVTVTFVKESYTVTKAQVADGGSFTLSTDAETVEFGTEVTVTPRAADTYELDAITVTKTDDENTTVTVSDDNKFTMPAYPVTVTVTFKKIQYTVTKTEVTEGGSYEVATLGEDNKVDAGTEITITPTADSGYEIDKVYVYTGETPGDGDEITNNEGYKKTITGDVKVKVTFKKSDYNLTGTAVGPDEDTDFTAGTVTFKATNAEGDVITTAQKDDTVYVVAPEIEGYTASTYAAYAASDNEKKTNLISSGQTFTMPAEAVTVTVTYEKNAPATYEVVFKKNADAEATKTVTKNVDEALTESDVPQGPEDESGVFLGWYLSTDENKEVVTDWTQVKAAGTYYAKYDPYYTITVDSELQNGTITVTKVDDKADVLTKSVATKTVSFTVAAGEGYHIKDGSVKVTYKESDEDKELTTEEDGGITESEGTYTFNMPAADATITAEFEEDPTVVIAAIAETDGTATVDNQTAKKDETVTLTVVPESGKRVSGVTVTNTVPATEPEGEPTVKTVDVIGPIAGNAVKYAFVQGEGTSNVTVSFVDESETEKYIIANQATWVASGDETPHGGDLLLHINQMDKVANAKNVAIARYAIPASIKDKIVKAEILSTSASSIFPSDKNEYQRSGINYAVLEKDDWDPATLIQSTLANYTIGNFHATNIWPTVPSGVTDTDKEAGKDVLTPNGRGKFFVATVNVTDGVRAQTDDAVSFVFGTHTQRMQYQMNAPVLKLTLGQIVDFKITVPDTEGTKPLAGAKIKISKDGEQVAELTTDANGAAQAAFENNSGDYTYTVEHADYAKVTDGTFSVAEAAVSKEHTLAANAVGSVKITAPESVIVTSSTSIRFTASAYDQDGRAMSADIKWSIVNDPTGLSVSNDAETSGTVTATSEATAGTYQVKATAAGKEATESFTVSTATPTKITVKKVDADLSESDEGYVLATEEITTDVFVGESYTVASSYTNDIDTSSKGAPFKIYSYQAEGSDSLTVESPIAENNDVVLKFKSDNVEYYYYNDFSGSTGLENIINWASGKPSGYSYAQIGRRGTFDLTTNEGSLTWKATGAKSGGNNTVSNAEYGFFDKDSGNNSISETTAATPYTVSFDYKATSTNSNQDVLMEFINSDKNVVFAIDLNGVKNKATSSTKYYAGGKCGFKVKDDSVTDGKTTNAEGSKGENFASATAIETIKDYSNLQAEYHVEFTVNPTTGKGTVTIKKGDETLVNGAEITVDANKGLAAVYLTGLNYYDNSAKTNNPQCSIVLDNFAITKASQN